LQDEIALKFGLTETGANDRIEDPLRLVLELDLCAIRQRLLQSALKGQRLEILVNTNGGAGGRRG
jgi:hypothetical protein